MVDLILIRTKHDPPTHYMHEACKKVIEEAKKQNKSIINIEGNDINKKNVTTRLEKLSPKLFFFNGHGTKSSLFDNTHKPFFTKNDAHLLKNTVAYARACDCLADLGKEAVQKGCTAFIGYKKNFWLARDNAMTSRPLKDKIAKPILESSNAIVIELLRGKTVEKAIKKSHEIAAKSIVKLIYSNDPYMSATLPALINNDSALGLYGDGSATINSSS